MKRLFATLFTPIFALVALGMVYGQAVLPQDSLLHSISYCNAGPLTAINFGMSCIKVAQENAPHFDTLAVYADLRSSEEQLEEIFNAYEDVPETLQSMKDELCSEMGLPPHEIQLKLNVEKDRACTNTAIKLISVGKSFLRKTPLRQRGVLAHELGHLKHNDCENRLHFDIASSYASAIGAQGVACWLPIPAHLEVHKPLARLVQTALGRAHERRADREAAQVPGGAQGLMEDLEIASKNYKKPAHIFDTHPPFAERIASLKSAAEQHPVFAYPGLQAWQATPGTGRML
jgi:hypothetical protein